jgi:hypothetical protein
MMPENARRARAVPAPAAAGQEQGQSCRIDQTDPQAEEETMARHDAKGTTGRKDAAATTTKPDGEHGAESAVPPAPRTEPARTPDVHVSGTEDHEVRAGPGDAGASDRPDRGTEPVQGSRDMWRRALVILAVVLVAWLVLSFFVYG